MKIITALGNPEINIILKNETNYEIIIPDIQYQEGIFEVLEKQKIDILILSELLKGELNIYELINKIKTKYPEIKIIMLLEKENEELNKFLYKNNIHEIFYHNKNSIQEVKNAIMKQGNEEKIVQEIEDLKQLILKKQKKKNLFEKRLKNKENEKKNNNTKVISVLGSSGVGKSIICTNLAINHQKLKILIIDFDFLHNSIHTIFGVKKYPKKIENKLVKQEKIKLEELIIKVNKDIHLICGIDYFFKENIDFSQIKNEINELKKNYNLIIFDTASDYDFKYIKELVKYSDTAIFLVEANLLEIKKAKDLLKIYKENFNIEIKKIKIIFNKFNKTSIDLKILRNIFSEYQIIGKISFNEKYNLIINRNIKLNYISTKLRKEYKKIIKKIYNLERRRNFYYGERIIRKFRNFKE